MDFPLTDNIRCDWPETERCVCRDRGNFCYVSHKYRYLYFSSPKCCSSTLKKYLPDKIGCASSSRYQDYYSFGVVRNPWDIVASMYVNSVEQLPHFGRTAFRIADPSSVTFREFLDIIRAHRNCHLEQLSKYIPPDVSYVIRFESFDDGLEVVRKALGLKSRNSMWINRCEHKDYRTYYGNDSMVDVVADMYKDDIARYGYSYE